MAEQSGEREQVSFSFHSDFFLYFFVDFFFSLKRKNPQHCCLYICFLNRPFPSCLLPLFQNGQVRNHSNENEFDLHENEHASETNFHMKGFAPRLVLRKRQKSTRKWPIVRTVIQINLQC